MASLPPVSIVNFSPGSFAAESPFARTPLLRSDPQLQRIFALLRDYTGQDFSNYKMSTLTRRIEHRMAVTRAETLAGYAHYLHDHPAEITGLFKALLIQVTSFFRDPETWTTLRSCAIPALFADRLPESPVRVWVPGCATGEEAYTIAFLICDYLEHSGREHPVQIFATDINSEAVVCARPGRYPADVADDVPADLAARYFAAEDGCLCVRKKVRDLLVFGVQSVVTDPPLSRLDLISCRNLFIYMDTALQQRLLRNFHYALRPQGYLQLGAAESIGAATDLFAAIDRKTRLYQARSV
jgi:two-component system, chemotaxis family, CheB/CheR fusion protein